MRRAGALALLCSAPALARPAPFPHAHPVDYYDLPPRERLHGYIGAGAHAAPIVGSELPGDTGGPEATHGAGGSVFGGVRFGPVVAIEFGYTASYFGTNEQDRAARDQLLSLQSFDFGVKIHAPTGRLVEPYVQLSVGGAVLGDAFGNLAEGNAFAAGLGADFWLHPNLTVGARALYRAHLLSEPGPGVAGDDTFISFVGLGLDFAARL